MNAPKIAANASWQRLSDPILTALDVAIEQQDVVIAEVLVNALELTLTRKTGGADFTEKRDYPPRIDATLEKFHKLKAKRAAGG